MTEQEKTAMKAVLYLAERNPKLRMDGTWVEDVHNIETCQKISFIEAVNIVGSMLYGSAEETKK